MSMLWGGVGNNGQYIAQAALKARQPKSCAVVPSEEEPLDEIFESVSAEYRRIELWIDVCLGALAAGCIVGIVWVVWKGGLV